MSACAGSWTLASFRWTFGHTAIQQHMCRLASGHSKWIKGLGFLGVLNSLAHSVFCTARHVRVQTSAIQPQPQLFPHGHWALGGWLNLSSKCRAKSGTCSSAFPVRVGRGSSRGSLNHMEATWAEDWSRATRHLAPFGPRWSNAARRESPDLRQVDNSLQTPSITGQSTSQIAAYCQNVEPVNSLTGPMFPSGPV